MNPPRYFRLLIIEDDPARIRLIQSWLPADVRVNVASSAGRAMGTLRRDTGNVYSGILLDHDLQDQRVTEEDQELSASDLLSLIIQHIAPDVPVLVHSMNPVGAPMMVRSLETAGFYVTRIRMCDLNRGNFQEWLAEAREIWADQWDE
jgi:CheY-like chemotaxis protein